MMNFLAGGGALGALMRNMDWSATTLGPTDTWPQSLRTSVSTCLNCSFPILVWWGPELVKLYNDAYAIILGDKHPYALGTPGQKVWPEIWDTIGPMLGRVMDYGEATPANDLPLLLHRHGYPEQCWFSFSYSPIRDEVGRVVGVFCPVIETTARVLAERRSAALLDLERALRLASSPLAVKAAACALIGRHLGVSQVCYFEPEEDGKHVLVEGAWDDGRVTAVSGRYRLDNYGASLIADLRQDRMVVVADVKRDPRTDAPSALEQYAAIPVRSFLGKSHIRADRLAAILFASDPMPRRWEDYEVELMRDAAERIWPALERIRAEAAILAQNAQLEVRVAREVAAREQAQARLAQAQRMEALGQLAGGIAHDFNNVLQAVTGGLGLIGRRARNADEVRRLARMAEDAAQRGAAITGRLLAFARKSELQATPVAPLALLDNLRDILVLALGASIKVRTDVAPNIPSLLVDRAQLETVLVNLAVNARDAMPDGGTLHVTAHAEVVAGAHAVLAGAGAYVRLDLTDTGAGMTAEILARASEPFFTTKPTGQGTGLGLAMASGFAQQSGGGFALRSAPGQGTTVTLWFPQAGTAAEASVLTGATAEPRSVRPARVLVVDDDAMVRAVVAGHLKDSGYNIAEAPNGLDALARLDAGEVADLLVTDFSMPGMNGLMLIKEARQRLPGLPALLLTGYADAGFLPRIEEALNDATALLQKPVSGDALAARAAALLDDAADRRRMDSEGTGNGAYRFPVPAGLPGPFLLVQAHLFRSAKGHATRFRGHAPVICSADNERAFEYGDAREGRQNYPPREACGISPWLIQ